MLKVSLSRALKSLWANGQSSKRRRMRPRRSTEKLEERILLTTPADFLNLTESFVLTETNAGGTPVAFDEFAAAVNVGANKCFRTAFAYSLRWIWPNNVEVSKMKKIPFLFNF